MIRGRVGLLSAAILLLYLAVIVYFVLFSDKLGRVRGYADYQYNLVPFQEIGRYIIYRDRIPSGGFLLNLFGNLLILMPMGFLMPLMRKKETGLVRIIINSLLFSLGIETLQLISKVGVFDVDDLILNTLGGLIGYLLYRLFRLLCQKPPGHEKNNPCKCERKEE